MNRVTSRFISAAVALGVGLGATAAVVKDAVAWEPKKPVEFVIMAGKGGGADRLARFIQGIIEKNSLASKPFVPINKGGGSGAEALRYLKDRAGDPHVIMATLNSYHTNWKMGGTGKGQEDSLVTAMLEKKFGIKVTYVPYKGGGTVAKELIGKHIDSTVNNPSEQAGFWEAGKSRPLASFTPKGKLQGRFGDIPTFEELGYGADMVYYMQRSVIAPAGIDKDVQAYYVGVFEKVYASEEWQGYLAKKGLIPGWLTGSALTEYFIAEREAHRQMLKAAGEID